MPYSPKSSSLGMEEQYYLKIPPEFPLHIYKAIVSLTCSQCQDIIQPEEIFTRSCDKKGTKPGIKYLHCTKCKPIA